MSEVKIKEKKPFDKTDGKEKTEGWEFIVEVKEDDKALEYKVTLDKSYWKSLSAEKGKPEDLVRRSFEFLLERESKESILSQFDLRIIQKYFPTYEAKIKIAKEPQ